MLDSFGLALADLDVTPTVRAAINTSPVISVPGAQSATSNVALAITGTSISDPESQSQTVAITVTNGTFSLASTTGLSFTVGDGTADAAMTFSGSLANCNTAIATLTFTSTTDFEGSSTLTINSTDSGGGVATQKTVAITVDWIPSSAASLVGEWINDAAYFYSDAGTTQAVVTDPVYRWTSKNSGSLYVENSTLGSRPVLNSVGGKLAITGTTGGKFLSNATFGPYNTGTFGFGIKMVTRGGASLNCPSGFNGPTSGNANVYLGENGSNNWFAGNNAGAAEINSATATDTNTHSLIITRTSGGNMQLYLDGVLLGTCSASGTGTAGIVLCQYGGGNYLWDGYIYTVNVFNAVLGATSLANLHTHIAGRM